MTEQAVCLCGHTAYWHNAIGAPMGAGECEHDGECRCKRFRPEPRNTHYAVVAFSGDPAGEHDDDELRGQAPSLSFIACGPEAFCWDAVARWVEEHPLREWESVEVLARDATVVEDGLRGARAYRAGLH